MATTLHRVRQNFVWRLKAVTPTCDISGERFEQLDASKLDKTDSQGLERSFQVNLLEGGPDLEATSAAYRSSVYTFLVQVVYWPGRGPDACHEIMLQDQWDMVKALRDDRLYVGYEDANPSTDICIVSRELEGQRVDYSDPEVWILQQTWQVQVTEYA